MAVPFQEGRLSVAAAVSAVTRWARLGLGMLLKQKDRSF